VGCGRTGFFHGPVMRRPLQNSPRPSRNSCSLPWLLRPERFSELTTLRIVEKVKLRLLTQMARVMEQGDMPWGLLIYVRSVPNLENVPPVANIILLSAQEFLESLRTTSFGDLVKRIRNQRVHGGS